MNQLRAAHLLRASLCGAVLSVLLLAIGERSATPHSSKTANSTTTPTRPVTGAMSGSRSVSELKSPSATRARVAAAYLRNPVMFEANEGQADPQVRFIAHGAGYSLFLAHSEAVLALAPPAGPATAAHTGSLLRLEFLGASPAAQISGRELLRGKTNYVLGNDPKQWHRGVPNYAAAEYHALYPGVNAVFHGGSVSAQLQRLEFDFEVAAGADPSRIALLVNGAQRLSLERDGDVLLQLDGRRTVVLGKPRVYQLIGGSCFAKAKDISLSSTIWRMY